MRKPASPRPERDLAANERDGLATIRRMLLALVLLGVAGMLLELLLLEHYESPSQWIPLGVLGAALVAGAMLGLRPSRGVVRAFRATMAMLVLTALVGLVLHYQGNAAFEREMDASAAGLALAWRSLRGATPALAPGAMAQIGILGLILAHRHPALRRDRGRGARPS